MKIKIYGKAHLEGTSKRTGNAYNFNQVHYLSPSRGVEGLAAKTLNLDPATYPLDRIILNSRTSRPDRAGLRQTLRSGCRFPDGNL